MRTTVNIKNLKCNHCKSLLIIELNTMEGISNIHIDIVTCSLSFDYTTHNVMEGLRAKLAEIGYPITRDPNRIVL